MIDRKIAIGKIVKAHGVKGDILFDSYSGEFDYRRYPRYLVKDGKEFKEIVLKSSKPHQGKRDSFLIALEGLSREEVQQRYLGREVYVDSLDYSALKEDEFFFSDLIDADVFIDKEKKGTVIGIFNFGSQDVVQVKMIDQNKKGKEQVVFLPLQKDFLIEMDLENKGLYFENVENFL